MHDFRVFSIFSLSRFRTPFWTHFGHHFGSSLAPMLAESCLGTRLGAPKSELRALWFGPGGLQELSERPPRGLQAAKTTPRALQEASGSILEPFWSYSGSYLGAIWEPFWSHWGIILDSMDGRGHMMTRTSADDRRTSADDYTDVGT